jgi:hypothetical protein
MYGHKTYSQHANIFAGDKVDSNTLTTETTTTTDSVEIVFTVCWEIVAVKKKKKGQVSIA